MITKQVFLTDSGAPITQMVPQTRLNKWPQRSENLWANQHSVCKQLYPYYHGIDLNFKGNRLVYFSFNSETHLSDREHSLMAKKVQQNARRDFVNEQRSKSLSRLYQQRTQHQAVIAHLLTLRLAVLSVELAPQQDKRFKYQVNY